MESRKKVFIESTALFQLGPRLDRVDFSKLLEYRPAADFDLYVSEVSWLEYLRERKAEIKTVLDKLRQAKSELDKHGQGTEIVEQGSDKVRTYLENIEAKYAEKAKLQGIVIVPTVRVDLARLLHMSINCIAPFEQSNEKGFRDSLILFTILEITREQPDVEHVVITDDRLLSQALASMSSEFHTSIRIVKDFEEANGYIFGQLHARYRDYLRAESEEAKEALSRFSSQIADRVKEIKEIALLEYSPISRALSGSEERFTIEKVVEVSFQGIEAALWKNKSAESSTILFKIGCKVRAHVSEPRYPFFGDQKFVVGADKKFLTATMWLMPETEERELPVSFFGEATLARAEQGLSLVSLRIDEHPPEEYLRLAVELGSENAV
jgi:hypothetical protein